jgi:Tol biopolymer transport system component
VRSVIDALRDATDAGRRSGGGGALVTALVTVALLALGACGGDDTDDASVTTTVEALPDLGGGRLMYSRFDESTHSFESTHIASPDGSDEVELRLPGPEGGGGWSNDGELIAVMTLLGDERVGTAIIRPDGTVARVLTIRDPTLNLVCPVWSGDDSRLACEGWDDGDTSRRGVYEVDAADGGNLVRLTTAPAGSTDIPGDYSPDGESFAFWRGADEGDGTLMVQRTDADATPAALSDRTFENEPRFSPDGALVLSAGGGRVFVLDLDGEVRFTIEEKGRFLFGASWSPTGEWIAYSSTAQGRFRADIYVSRMDGSDSHQITDTPANEIALDWSRR